MAAAAPNDFIVIFVALMGSMFSHSRGRGDNRNETSIPDQKLAQRMSYFLKISMQFSIERKRLLTSSH